MFTMRAVSSFNCLTAAQVRGKNWLREKRHSFVFLSGEDFRQTRGNLSACVLAMREL